MTLERITIETDGLEFAALRTGDGEKYAFFFHGFPDDAGSMRPLMEAFADDGYTAIAPYMRGYGDTECPPLVTDNFTIPLLASDVLSVVNAFDAKKPVVVGHDWGAIAVTTVSRFDPTFASHCVTLSVPPDFLVGLERHPSQVLRSWYMTFFQIPGLAEESLRRDDFALIERLWNLWSPNWTFDPDRLEAVKDTFRTGQTVTAALLYYRALFEHVLSRPADELNVSGIAVPTLLVGGQNDGCIGANLFEESHTCYDRRQETLLVDGAGHFVHQEAPGTVTDAIRAFIDS